MNQNLWILEIELNGKSFENIKEAARYVAKHIEGAKTSKELGCAGGGMTTFNQRTSFGYSITLRSPVEARIKELRAEADRLEREAGSA